MDEGGCRLTQMNESGCVWRQLDESGCRWMQMDACGGRWINVVESGWKLMKISAVLHASLKPLLYGQCQFVMFFLSQLFSF